MRVAWRRPEAVGVDGASAFGGLGDGPDMVA